MISFDVSTYIKLFLESSELSVISAGECDDGVFKIPSTDLCVSTCQVVQDNIMDEHILFLSYFKYLTQDLLHTLSCSHIILTTLFTIFIL